MKKKAKFTTQDHIRILFAAAINKDAVKKAMKDPEFVNIINKVKY